MKYYTFLDFINDLSKIEHFEGYDLMIDYKWARHCPYKDIIFEEYDMEVSENNSISISDFVKNNIINEDYASYFYMAPNDSDIRSIKFEGSTIYIDILIDNGDKQYCSTCDDLECEENPCPTYIYPLGKRF